MILDSFYSRYWPPDDSGHGFFVPGATGLVSWRLTDTPTGSFENESYAAFDEKEQIKDPTINCPLTDLNAYTGGEGVTIGPATIHHGLLDMSARPPFRPWTAPTLPASGSADVEIADLDPQPDYAVAGVSVNLEVAEGYTDCFTAHAPHKSFTIPGGENPIDGAYDPAFIGVDSGGAWMLPPEQVYFDENFPDLIDWTGHNVWKRIWRYSDLLDASFLVDFSLTTGGNIHQHLKLTVVPLWLVTTAGTFMHVL